jgi:hypothetical protein
VDAADGLADERRDRERLDLGDALGRRQRDGIGDHHLAEHRVTDALDRGIRQDAVRGAGVDLSLPSRCRARTTSISVPPVSISSSTMIARRPRTSPMTFISSARSRLPTRRSR